MERSLIGKVEGHVYIPRLHRVYMGWASLAILRKMIDGQNVLKPMEQTKKRETRNYVESGFLRM